MLPPSEEVLHRAQERFEHPPELSDCFAQSIDCAVLLHGCVELFCFLNPRGGVCLCELPDGTAEILDLCDEIIQRTRTLDAVEEIRHSTGERLPLFLCRFDVLVELIPILTERRLLALHVTVVIVDEEEQRAHEEHHARQRVRLHDKCEPRQCGGGYFHPLWEALPHPPESFPDAQNKHQKMLSDVDDVDEHARSFLRPDAHVLDEHVIETAELLPRLCKRTVQVLHEIVPDPRHGIADLLLEPCELKHEVAEPLHGRLEVPADLHLLPVCGELVESLHQLRGQHNVLDGFAEGIRRCLHRPRGILADHHLAGQLLHGEVLRCGGLHQAEDGGGHACDRRADHRRSADEIRRHVSRRCLHSAVKAVNRRLGLSKARLVQAHAKADQIFLDHLTDHCLTSLCSAAYTSARRRFSPSTSMIS